MDWASPSRSQAVIFTAPGVLKPRRRICDPSVYLVAHDGAKPTMLAEKVTKALAKREPFDEGVTMNNPEIDNVAVAKKALAHLNLRHEDRFVEEGPGGFEPFFDSLADDAVFWVPCAADTPRYGEPARGKKAIIDLFLSDPEYFEGIDAERPAEFIGCNDGRVLVLFAMSYKIKKTGVTHRNGEIALVMDFRDGKITQMYEYQDMSPWSLAYR